MAKTSCSRSVAGVVITLFGIRLGLHRTVDADLVGDSFIFPHVHELLRPRVQAMPRKRHTQRASAALPLLRAGVASGSPSLMLHGKLADRVKSLVTRFVNQYSLCRDCCHHIVVDEFIHNLSSGRFVDLRRRNPVRIPVLCEEFGFEPLVIGCSVVKSMMDGMWDAQGSVFKVVEEGWHTGEKGTHRLRDREVETLEAILDIATYLATEFDVDPPEEPALTIEQEEGIS